MSVYLDGRFAFGLPAIVAAPLKVGQPLSDAEIELLKENGAVEEAYNQALSFLSSRPRSRAELVAHLQHKGATAAEIARIADRLESAGLLGDEAFARFWVENRERFRPRGRIALRYELHSKGVSDEVIESALEQVDISEGAYQAARTKAEQWSHLDRVTFRRKVVDYLGRRGFEYDVAREAADRHWAELKGEG